MSFIGRFPSDYYYRQTKSLIPRPILHRARIKPAQRGPLSKRPLLGRSVTATRYFLISIAKIRLKFGICPLSAFGLTIKNPLVQRISRGACDCRCPAIRIPSGKLPVRLARRQVILFLLQWLKFHPEVLPGPSPWPAALWFPSKGALRAEIKNSPCKHTSYRDGP